MNLYLIGRAITGLVMAWGTAALIVWLLPPFPENSFLLFAVPIWLWMVGVGTFIARLLDWRKSSDWKADGKAVVVTCIVWMIGGSLLDAVLS